jgi:hypothetical protein
LQLISDLVCIYTLIQYNLRSSLGTMENLSVWRLDFGKRFFADGIERVEIEDLVRFSANR